MTTQSFASSLRDFTNSEEIGLREYYVDNGYVTIRGLIDSPLIDALLDVYKRDVVPSREKFFRQNTSAYETNVINEFGHVQQSFLDIHDYRKHSAFSQAAVEIFRHPKLFDCLRRVTQAPDLALMQSMLFDQNVGTPPHQDWWYLDSRPAGHLLGAWFALEDINPSAGRFYLLPKTMHINMLEENPNLSHKAWQAKMQILVDKHKEEVHIPEMRKGDVILWNSRTVHGSMPTLDSKYSRKSLTAHYLPDPYAFGNLFKDKSTIVKFKKAGDLRFYRNQPDYSFYNSLKFGFKHAVYNSPRFLKYLRIFQ